MNGNWAEHSFIAAVCSMACDGPSRKWLPSREVMHSTTSASAPRRSITLFLPLFFPFASFLASNSNPLPEKPFGVAYAYYPIVYKSVLVQGVSHNSFSLEI